jgi:PKD repeat protein
MDLRNRFTLLLLPFIFLLGVGILPELSAQQKSDSNYEIRFASGAQLLPENAADEILAPNLTNDELVEGQYYRIVQFFNLPDSRERKLMEQKGVQFLNYLPKNAYVVSLPAGFDLQVLSEGGARTIAPIQAIYKISPNLQTGSFEDFALKGDKVKVILKSFENITPAVAKRLAEEAGVSILEAFGKSNLLQVLLDPADIEKVADLPFVKYLERIPPPGMPEDDLGRGLHRSNVMDSQYAGGRKYTGDGVNVLVRDDGRVGPHIDYKGRLNDLAVGDGGLDHADGVAGVMGGAGNLNPRYRATAPGSFIYVINYANHFQDTTLGLHQFQDVKITNSSYSDGCNDGYTTATETVDQQIYENPTLMHVFSAGNSNGADCGYGAGNQWGNITGGHKQAKNSIATGNLNSDGSLVGSSSRGPAHDGRIKPDICANGQDYVAAYPDNTYQGFGGTSGAAPGIAGTMATLYQAFRELNNGIDPESALIKACILNTANDLGNKGPDFRYGWGHVNARRAVEVLENETWLNDEIDQAGANSHDIILPDNVLELRVMLYWSDPAASVMTNKALVNNLDLQVVSPTTGAKLPLILDPTPDPASLDAVAVPGVDDLNNVEQVYLENPEAGTYTVEVLGTEVPMGPQNYFIVYEIITNEITVTYPIGGEGFEPFSQERIHWDAVGDAGDFTLEYTSDDGASWNSIATVSGDSRMYMWNIPNDVSGQVRVRVTRDNVSDESDANFSIAYVPTNVNIVQVCPDYVRIDWTPAPGANKYDIFVLGDRYMDSIGTSNILIYDIPNPFPMDEEMWIAVRSVGNNGIRSRRSIAIPYSGLLNNCQQDNDLAAGKAEAGDLQGSSFGCDDIIADMDFSISNVGMLPATNFEVVYQINNAAPVVEIYTDTIQPGDMVNYTFATPLSIDSSGAYEVKAWTNLTDNNFTYDDTTSFEFDYLKYDIDNAVSADYQEAFESSAFPPDLWLNENPDSDAFGWEDGEVTGITGDETTVAWTNNYSFNGQGTEDYLVTPLIDLTDASLSFPVLTFDYAYTFYTSGGSTLTDGMRVEASIDCGLTFSEILFDKDGADLATVPAIDNNFFPEEASDWRTEFLDLSPYVGGTLLIRFVNENGWGNNLFLDNINVVEVTAPSASIDASALEVCDNETLTFTALDVVDFASYSWSYGAGTFPNGDNGPGPHSVQFLTPGENVVTLIASNPAGADTAEVTITINPLPDPDFTVEEIGPGEFSFTNASTDADTYEWDFGDDSPVSTEENPTHQYDENGDYTVTLTVTNDCGTRTTTEQVNAVVNSLIQLDNPFGLQVLPNPSNGLFQLSFQGSVSSDLRFELHDLQGKLIKSYSFDRERNSSQTIFTFDAQSLSEGVYLLKVMDQEKSMTRKIIIQR